MGQPAGAGLAVGRARVALDENDLYRFVRGEILVCDSLDPTMTFVAPLASAIVERRGGMLVHGAIIAREYGLPCVTGVPDATLEIHTAICSPWTVSWASWWSAECRPGSALHLQSHDADRQADGERRASGPL